MQSHEKKSERTSRLQKTESAADLKACLKSFRLHESDNRLVVENFFISLDTPVSLSCYLLYKYCEYDQLVSKDLNPKDYNDPWKFRDDFAAISFMRKNASLKTSFDKQDIALQAFIGAEEKCKESNERIKTYLRTGNIYPGGEYLLSAIIRKIDRILGEFCIDEMLDHCSWGPGVTQAVKGSDTSASRKFDIESEITLDAYDLFGDVLKQTLPEMWGTRHVRFKRGNVIITVPKNAKTDRTIAVEPGLNSWFQLGTGKVLRKRLRQAGYNLNSDLKNQRGAYIGSITGDLATVDFKAASDTISLETVRLLLPKRWFTVLDSLRSKYFTLNNGPHAGTTRFSEKFSTMGNGFTFELESLIFLAVGSALCDTLGLDDTGLSIFGDDLVLPSLAVEELQKICTFLGFTINTQKSFSDGYFRESCGSYYFNGIDVKPVFNKKDLVYVKDVYRMANAISSLSHRFNSRWGRDARFARMWSLLVHRLPLKLRFFGPLASGDATIHQNLDECDSARRSPQLEGYYYSGLPEVPIDIYKDSLGLLYSRLHRPSVDECNNFVPLRGRTRIILKRKMFVHQWYTFGPWI